VLKVAHHGSAYQDPRFLAAVHPSVALVSVGAGNRYGHPSLGVLRRLDARGAFVRRTDMDGDLAVTRHAGHLTVVVTGRSKLRGRAQIRAAARGPPSPCNDASRAVRSALAAARCGG
jgi:competence protein ComEC